MNVFTARSRHLVARRRVAAVLTGLALAAPLTATLPNAVAAEPARTATTSVDSSYLADVVGLPASTVVETVTYDRFQWLLQQPGQFAFLIGSTTDADFTTKAVAADAAARAAGVKKIYWFDPNLTGQKGVLNLDTRKAAGIDLAADSQAVFGNIWNNVVAQYLGNGTKATVAANGNSVTLAADAAVVNDAVDPIFDARPEKSDAVAADSTLFLVYDKDRLVAGAPDKVIDWADLSATADVTGEVTGVVAAAGGGTVVDEIGQFSWWKAQNNSRHKVASPDEARYGGDIITDADDTKGWRVQQVTYPELVHLLDAKEAGANFALLFGGTWCPNTRAVIADVNREAQENGVRTVYNFDLVLDGGITNGSNGAANPIHVRDNANRLTVNDFRPSFVYGDLVRKYFRNAVTEYDPHTGNRVAYYPGNDQAAFPDVVRKLQVPFLVNYERGTGNNPSNTAIKRQWIQQNVDSSTGLATFKEYMTNAWFTNPSKQLGLSFAIPADESTLSEAEAAQLEQARTSLAFGQEAKRALGDFFGGLPGAVRASRTVTAANVTFGTAPQVKVAITNKFGRVASGAVTVKVGTKTFTGTVVDNSAVVTLGKLAPGKHTFTVTYAGGEEVLGFTETGAVTVAKAKAGAVTAKVTKAPTTKKAGKATLTVTSKVAGVKPSGKVTVTLKKAKKTTKVVGTLKNGSVAVKLPKLAKGTWTVSLAYAGDTNHLSATGAGTKIVVKK
ncbi:Ig-like domain-containing protein [Nocardioides yefusunii]|uniref:Ig-like domain-containing protein n=1 Tax=Nocardioides yefusunii TaxID=2500546 RepID=A0ABW1QVN0_9ACTN|nr:Ig-like domain-containing protein [Nocardioides yefusunii]